MIKFDQIARATMKLLAIAGGGVTLLSSAFAGSYQLKSGPGIKNPSGGTITTSVGTVPYIGGGAVGSDEYIVHCQGVISTVYEWVPRRLANPNPAALSDADPSNDTIPDALDTPPENVIAIESCKATYSGYYLLPFGLGEGECNNGLGFTATTYNIPITLSNEGLEGEPPLPGTIIGYSFGGTSEGILYTKRAGGATITLTCSPVAKAQGFMGGFGASVIYSSSILVPSVSLAGTTRFFAPDAIKLITGQGVTASLTSSGGGLVTAAGPLEGGGLSVNSSSQVWSLSGAGVDPFKNFTSGSIGQRIDHSAADFKGSKFDFFTNKGGSTKVVCSFKYNLPTGAKFAGGLPDFEAKSKEFESVRPQFVGWEVNNGSVTLGATKFAFGGDADSTNGQQWYDVIINLAAPFGNVGQGSFCQLITATRDVWRTTAPVHFVKSPHNGVEAIDMNMPYPYGPVWNITGKGSGVDTPEQPLYLDPVSAWYRSKADDSFQTWAMYRPPALGNQPTTYIPIARYTWAWNGEASRTFNNNTNAFNPWQLISSGGGMMGAPEEWFFHPSWNKTSRSPFGFAPANN